MKNSYYGQGNVLLSVISLRFGRFICIVCLTRSEDRISGADVRIGEAIGLGVSLLYALRRI